MTDASIILPAYEEAETAPRVIRELARELRGSGIDAEVVVMDDSPGRETAAAVKATAVGVSLPVRLVRRSGKPDLSRAILEGFDRATGERLVVMDADGQHPTASVPDLLYALEDVDVAVGSRHDGGHNHADWSTRRYLMSFGASVIAWLAVPDSRRLQDPMSGFFAVRREVVDATRRRLNPRGYKILLEVLGRCPVDSVAEIPVDFHPRPAGESNTDWRQNLRFLRHMRRLAAATRRRPRTRRAQVNTPRETHPQPATPDADAAEPGVRP